MRRDTSLRKFSLVIAWILSVDKDDQMLACTFSGASMHYRMGWNRAKNASGEPFLTRRVVTNECDLSLAGSFVGR